MTRLTRSTSPFSLVDQKGWFTYDLQHAMSYIVYYHYFSAYIVINIDQSYLLLVAYKVLSEILNYF